MTPARLSNNATTTATTAVTLLLGPHCSRGLRTGSDRAARTPRSLFLIELSDLADELAERLIDVDSLLGGGLDELAVEVFCQITALVHADLSLVFQIALVGHDDDGE